MGVFKQSMVSPKVNFNHACIQESFKRQKPIDKRMSNCLKESNGGFLSGGEGDESGEGGEGSEGDESGVGGEE